MGIFVKFGFILVFIKVGIDEIFEVVVSGLWVEIYVVVHLLFVPDLRQLITVGFGGFVKGCAGFSEGLLLLLGRVLFNFVQCFE